MHAAAFGVARDDVVPRRVARIAAVERVLEDASAAAS